MNRRRIIYFALLFLVFPLSYSISTRAQVVAGRAECRSVQSKILAHPIPYCVLLPAGYDDNKTARFPIVYLLHGLGENEQILVNSSGMSLIQDLRSQQRIGQFLIVTPAAQRSFYINSRDGKTRYEDFFIREFIPYIETHYRVRAGRHDRGIAGISMGGYGALRFAFKYPQIFGAVSANSPALIKTLPKVQLSDQQEAGMSRMLGPSFGVPFDAALWERNNVFTLAKSSTGLAGIKIYFDCGTDDDYGFNVGAQSLDELLKSRHISHEFHLYPGGHSWEYFAAHLPDSLEFQSRAFAVPAKLN